MPSVNSVEQSTERNYQNMEETIGADKTKTRTINAVFDDGKSSEVGFQDLFSLMINQLTNQDFMNPVDDAQYLAQMTQIASMSAMQELADFSKAQYMMSFLGKEVTASKYEVGSSDLLKEQGIVTELSLVNKEYLYTVNGKKFTADQLMLVHNPTGEADSDDKTDNSTGEVDTDNKTDDTTTDNANSGSTDNANSGSTDNANSGSTDNTNSGSTDNANSETVNSENNNG
jgi:flagellar basal-body rod modification protein FlgD